MTKGDIDSRSVMNDLFRQCLCFVETSKAVHSYQNIVVVFVGVAEVDQLSKAGAELFGGD
jgi:hypothetical protein